MNLDQLLSLEGIEDYDIWWYGAQIHQDFMDDNGLLKSTIELPKNRGYKPNHIYLIMSGVDGKRCRYRFAIKLFKAEAENIYQWERVPLKLDEYSGRIIFYRETGFSFYNSSATGQDFIVEEIWGKVSNRTVKPFVAYDEVELSFAELKEVIDNHYSDYYKALSCIKGIYMIIDGNTGKMYVGSAYGKEGIWGRWNSYADSFHGNNEELLNLYNSNGESYFYQFKYIILHILPMKTSDSDVIDKENYYKSKFMTREFGLNKN